MRILILGASGMLGYTLFFELFRHTFDVYGTVRAMKKVQGLLPKSWEHFMHTTGYVAPAWQEILSTLRTSHTAFQKELGL